MYYSYFFHKNYISSIEVFLHRQDLLGHKCYGNDPYIENKIWLRNETHHHQLSSDRLYRLHDLIY